MPICAIILSISSFFVTQGLGPKPTCSFGEAIENGDVKEVRANLRWPSSRFVYRDAPLNKTGITPLHVAAKSGHLELVKYLISQGVPVNNYGHWSYNKTPLQLAKANGHVAVVKYLREKGAIDSPLPKNGSSNLDKAVKQRESSQVGGMAVDALIWVLCDFEKGMTFIVNLAMILDS